MLPTTPIVTGSSRLPVCTYQVLEGTSAQGRPIQFATVGQPVYHYWTCAGDNTDFCMTVHSCTVDDGQGRSQLLIDANGYAKIVFFNVFYSDQETLRGTARLLIRMQWYNSFADVISN